MRVPRLLPALLVVAALATEARPLAAQQAPARRIRLGIGAGSMAIDRAIADRERVHNRSFGGSVDVGVVAKRFLFLGADAGYHALSDHAAFTQSTTAGDMTSTAGVAQFSVMAGPQTRPLALPGRLPAVAFSLLGGATITSASRTIERCADCRTDDMEIPAGAFVEPSIALGSGKTRLRLADRHYLAQAGIRYLVSAGIEVGIEAGR